MADFVVVTDSTANLPEGVAEELGIPVIPLNVHWGEDTYVDGVTLDTPTFYRYLRERQDFPRTSQPSAGAFMEFFREVAETHDTDTILGVFISADLSGTLASATQARSELPELNLHLVDSRSVSMGLGVQVMLAAQAARAGASLLETRELLQQTIPAMHVIFAVDTLEFLHRGGRIGGAARLLGSALNLKPVLTIEDGRVEPLEKVRSRRKSLRRIVQLAKERAGDARLPILAIMHAEAEEDARWLHKQLQGALQPQAMYISELTPVVGTHGGPGTIGLAFCTLEEEH